MAVAHENFRTRVGGRLTGSGATINGTLELRAADIGGDIVFGTGRVSRLHAGVEAWVQNEAAATAPRFCGCVANGWCCST